MENRKGLKASITVFLSLSCILFLSLICAVTESARIQGAKAQSANITGMGTFSLLGEFENELLEKYEIFSLDGTYGSGSFQLQKVNSRLQEYISYNTDPKKDIFSVWTFDPWRLELTDSKISGYALLTDNNGEAFYQQAVSYMKENIGTAALEKLLDYVKDTDEIEEKQETYEKNESENDGTISALEAEKQQKLDELESEAQESGAVEVLPEEQTNPLSEIAKLRKKSTLEIVTWDKAISQKSVTLRTQPSKSTRQRGNLTLDAENSGLTANVLFREYLLQHFPNYAEGTSGAALDYQAEYILGGKATDKNNLKYVVNRLLLIREGLNYAYCASDTQMSAQAGSLATTLTGFLGIPALTAATKHALLLAWAYGESLIDVRILLDGGKVPLMKSSGAWSLTLENLGRVTEILQSGAEDKKEGLTYKDYLRILLHMGKLSNQKMRALDLIQAQMRTVSGMENFKVENCIVAVEVLANYRCGQVFLGLPQAVMGLTGRDTVFSQTASIAY